MAAGPGGQWQPCSVSMNPADFPGLQPLPMRRFRYSDAGSIIGSSDGAVGTESSRGTGGMLQRPWISVVIAAFWCLATGWLFVEKIGPSLSTGSPPGHGQSLVAGQPPIPVAWSVLWNDTPLGWALAESSRLDDGQIAVDSRLHLDRVPIDEMLPKWTAEVLATVLRPAGPSIRGQGMVVDSTSHFRFESGGRLRDFDAEVDLPGVGVPILFTGSLVDDTLSVSLRAGDLRYETRQQVPWHAVSGDELSPRAVLLGLFPGRRWQVSIFSPLRSNGSTVELLHAEVDGEEQIFWDGQLTWTSVVVYRPDPTNRGSHRFRIWVDRSGRVLRQEAAILAARLVFERRNDEAAAELVAALAAADDAAVAAEPDTP